MDIIQVISMICSVVSASTFILLFFQLKLLKKQVELTRAEINLGYDKSKKEKTVEYLFQWNTAVENIYGFSIQIAEKLDLNQCKNLYNNMPFEVSGEISKLVNKMCILEKIPMCSQKEGSPDVLIVNGEALSAIRSSVIKVLNATENILIAWQFDILDKGTIETQFKHLVDYQTGQSYLYNFRSTTYGGNSYPTIEMFCNTLKARVNKKTIEQISPKV